jgi:hypothetical protein
MIVNKKLGRFMQWAGEHMGGEVKTSTSDDFKALETEMTLRHEGGPLLLGFADSTMRRLILLNIGMERLQRSTTAYVKSVSRKSELTDEREKVLPVAYLGSTLYNHGSDFEPDSVYGNCLIGWYHH